MNSFERRIIAVGVSAIKASKTTNKFSHASLICHKGRILSIGLNNQYKTHTKALRFSKDWFKIHSELDAIIRFKGKSHIDTSSCSLYNIRILKSGSLGLSYPCEACLKLILASDFKRVYFSNNLGNFCRLW